MPSLRDELRHHHLAPVGIILGSAAAASECTIDLLLSLAVIVFGSACASAGLVLGFGAGARSASAREWVWCIAGELCQVFVLITEVPHENLVEFWWYVAYARACV